MYRFLAISQFLLFVDILCIDLPMSTLEYHIIVYICTYIQMISRLSPMEEAEAMDRQLLRILHTRTLLSASKIRIF